MQIHYSPSTIHLQVSGSKAWGTWNRAGSVEASPVNTPPPGWCPHSVPSLTLPTKTLRCCERKLMFCSFVFCDFIHRIQFLHWWECFNLFVNIDFQRSNKCHSNQAAKKYEIKDTPYYSMLYSIKWPFLKLISWNSEEKNPKSVCIIFWTSRKHLHSVEIKYISHSF